MRTEPAYEGQCEQCGRPFDQRRAPAIVGRQVGTVCEECCSALRRLAESFEDGEPSYD